MAVVTSASNHVLTFSANSHEWPPLNEQYNESRQQESILVRNVNVNLITCQPSDAIISSLQAYINAEVELRKTSSENVNTVAQIVDADNVMRRSNTVCDVNNSDEFNESVKSVAALNDLANETLVSEPTERPSPSESSNVTSDYLDDVLVSRNEGPCEKTDCMLEHKNEENSGNIYIKKKKRLKKVRRKSNRKWKAYSIADLGFYISPASYFVDETATLEKDNADEVSCEGGVTQAETDECAVNSCETSIDAIVQDDIEFFLDLGIDVVNYDEKTHDDVQDWDGVYFSSLEYTSGQALHKKQSSEPNSELANKLAQTRNSQTKTSQKATPKPNGLTQPETSHTFPVPVFEFSKIKKSDKYKLFELECSSTKRIYIRRDRHRRKEKAHKAVKSKNCRSVLNKIGRKRMYMHHRLVKMHNLNLDFRGSVKSCRIPAMPKTTLAVDVAKVVFRADRKAQAKDRPVPPAQNLNHALHGANCAAGIEGDLANFLISLQHRDMTPEDYDMLLRLDDTVKPKTLPKNVLERLRTERIGPDGPKQGSNDWEPLCTICMEPYLTGQERKFLPCDHDFHTECIDKWLKNSSMNCPLDGLPVEAS